MLKKLLPPIKYAPPMVRASAITAAAQDAARWADLPPPLPVVPIDRLDDVAVSLRCMPYEQFMEFCEGISRNKRCPSGKGIVEETAKRVWHWAKNRTSNS